jgi:hypothetical protein
VADPNKDDFNLDDFQYSGVKLTPVPDFKESSPVAEPAALPAADPLAAAGPEDKKGKKKAKKEKPAKVKKEKPVKVKKVKQVYAEGEESQSTFLKKLTEASPYTVLLGLTVVALLIAVIFLFIELGRYDLNIKALARNDSITAPFDGHGMSEIESGPTRLSDLA